MGDISRILKHETNNRFLKNNQSWAYAKLLAWRQPVIFLGSFDPSTSTRHRVIGAWAQKLAKRGSVPPFIQEGTLLLDDCSDGT